MSRTRQEVVDHLVTLSKNRLKGVEDLVVDVFPYIPSNPQGISPYLCIVGAGTDPTHRRQLTYFINAYWFVLSVDAERTVSDQDPWSTLNTIAEAFFDVLSVNKRAEDFWTSIYPLEATSIDTFAVENHGYLVEVCPLSVDLLRR